MKYFLMYIKQTLRFVLKPLSFVPAIIMMLVIYSFSAQEGDQSSALSYEVGVRVLTIANETLDRGWSEERIEQLSEKGQFYIRRTAHFTEYFSWLYRLHFPFMYMGSGDCGFCFQRGSCA